MGATIGKKAGRDGSAVPKRPAERQGCGCTPQTPVRALCEEHKAKRRRILARIHRRGQGGRPSSTITLATRTLGDVLEALDALTETVDDLTSSGEPLSLADQQFAYGIEQLRTMLQPLMDAVSDEVVEINRPTTQYPRTYTPHRPKSIGGPKPQ